MGEHGVDPLCTNCHRPIHASGHDASGRPFWRHRHNGDSACMLFATPPEESKWVLACCGGHPAAFCSCPDRRIERV